MRLRDRRRLRRAWRIQARQHMRNAPKWERKRVECVSVRPVGFGPRVFFRVVAGVVRGGPTCDNDTRQDRLRRWERECSRCYQRGQRDRDFREYINGGPSKPWQAWRPVR